MITIYQSVKLHDTVTFQMLHCVVTLYYNVTFLGKKTFWEGGMTHKWQHQATDCVTFTL